jgi:dTDP-4-amino-4,6-dideoxygalactose transaminase
MTPKLQVPFAVPDIGEDEVEAVAECLRSGWLTTGQRAKQFEQDFSEFVGGGVEAVAVSSGTSGLEVSLSALGIGAGDEVITTDFTFSATAMSIVHVGAKPVLVDIDPDTLNINCESIKAAITSRTKAIMPVHYGGLACDMDAVGQIAQRHGLLVIEDAAHALPTSWKGRMVGQATSDASVFSFYATKTITTGEGGMITFRDPAIAKRARIYRLHGIDRDVFSRYQGTTSQWRYEIVGSGFKANLPDVLAAIGIVQLKRAWDFQKKRRSLARKYDDAFSTLPLLRPAQAPDGDVHAHHLYPIRLTEDSPIDRDLFISKMSAEGVNCSVHFIPLHLHSYWRETLGLSEDMFPHSQAAFEQLATLPLFMSMTDEMQDRVIDVTKQLLS